MCEYVGVNQSAQAGPLLPPTIVETHTQKRTQIENAPKGSIILVINKGTNRRGKDEGTTRDFEKEGLTPFGCKAPSNVNGPIIGGMLFEEPILTGILFRHKAFPTRGGDGVRNDRIYRTIDTRSRHIVVVVVVVGGGVCRSII